MWKTVNLDIVKTTTTVHFLAISAFQGHPIDTQNQIYFIGRHSKYQKLLIEQLAEEVQPKVLGEKAWTYRRIKNIKSLWFFWPTGIQGKDQDFSYGILSFSQKVLLEFLMKELNFVALEKFEFEKPDVLFDKILCNSLTATKT